MLPALHLVRGRQSVSQKTNNRWGVSGDCAASSTFLVWSLDSCRPHKVRDVQKILAMFIFPKTRRHEALDTNQAPGLGLSKRRKNRARKRVHTKQNHSSGGARDWFFRRALTAGRRFACVLEPLGKEFAVLRHF